MQRKSIHAELVERYETMEIGALYNLLAVLENRGTASPSTMEAAIAARVVVERRENEMAACLGIA